MWYPTNEPSNIEKVLKGIEYIFSKLEQLSHKNKDFELIEYHDMFEEGVLSPHCYYTAKYKYKDIFIKTGTLQNVFSGHCSWCEISNYEEDVKFEQNICVMKFNSANGFIYLWESLCEYREEIERLLFPDIYEEYDKREEENKNRLVTEDSANGSR